MVRIVFQGGRNKSAIASLLVVVVSAASVWAGYWVWHRDDQTMAVQRSIEDLIVRWRCPRGHVFDARGSYGARPCPTCTQPAQVLIAYDCSEHGTVNLRVMFDEQTGKPANVEFDSGKWINVSTIIPCPHPHCGRAMRPVSLSPFNGVESARNQEAGGARADLPS